MSSAPGDYEPLMELGEGGMGRVTLARSRGAFGFERLVALKRMKAELSFPGFEERFIREALLAAQVRHANVVSVQKLERDEDGLFLVCDYVEGAALDTLIERCQESGGRPPPPIAIRIVCDALAGLHAVHEAMDSSGNPLEILHRDVSTQNVLVGRDGIARLTDFGVARSPTHRQLTGKAQLFGKVLWMSPEYLMSLPVDRRLDVYAMGVTLWIALAGIEPWPEADETELMSKILHEGLPALSSTGLTLAPELEAIVARAIDPDPEKRFATAHEMQIAIENIARETGWMATHSEVAAFVDELEGRRLASRRAVIASEEVPRSSASYEAVTIVGRDAPARTLEPARVVKVESKSVPNRKPTSLGIGPEVTGSRPVQKYGGGTRLGIGTREPPLLAKVARPLRAEDEEDLPYGPPLKRWPWIAAGVVSLMIGILFALLIGR